MRAVLERVRAPQWRVPERAKGQAWVAWVAVLVLVLAALLLGLWGNDTGLPYSYNADENSHFVPRAIGLFGHGLNPHYFVNPPGYTYLLHWLFGQRFDGGGGVMGQFARDPTPVFLTARAASAVLLALAVWFLYLAGARLFDDRRIGVLAAGVLGFSFLPVFYGHLGLNDVPTLAPICIALFGVAGVQRFGRIPHLILAGAGLGAAAAFKYTGGVVLLPLLAAALLRRETRRGLDRRQMLLYGLPLAGLTAVVTFLLLNPYAVGDWSEFTADLAHQTQTADEAGGKLGLIADNGITYYLWTLTWGLGWVPLLAAVTGVVTLLSDRPRIAAVLLPAPVLFLVFMGAQERWFGRWLLPIYPLLALIAAHAVVTLSAFVWRRAPRLTIPLLVVGAIILWGQGLLAAIHIGGVLSRPDTRTLARAWMVDNVPERSKIVVEPIVPDAWAQDVGHPSPLTKNGNRWVKYAASRTRLGEHGEMLPPPGRVVGIEDYERTLYPGLIDDYEAGGYCWVVVGSTQAGRAEADPKAVPQAGAYYRELARRGTLVYHVAPFHAGVKPVPFNFDWSFDYYPGAYERPGPEIWIYRLDGGLCGGAAGAAGSPAGAEPQIQQ